MLSSLLACLVSCTSNTYLHRIETYLNAHTPEMKGKYMAEEYHSFFMEKKGEGESKSQALQSFLEWDAPLHTDIHILNYTTNGNTINLNFYSGRTMQFSINSNKDLDGSGYRLTRFPSLNGHTIEGVYSQPNQRADVNGKVRMATLHKNGRFEDDGLLLIGNLIDPSLPYQVWQQKTTENATPGNGNYVIVDNSLLLSYDDGRKIQLMIYISLEEFNSPSPKLVVVAGESFTLVK